MLLLILINIPFVCPDENAELWKGGKGMLTSILWIYIFSENKFICVYLYVIKS